LAELKASNSADNWNWRVTMIERKNARTLSNPKRQKSRIEVRVRNVSFFTDASAR
jgi:predicted rRNA methylase YqxC with S4 and FtsJ domains